MAGKIQIKPDLNADLEIPKVSSRKNKDLQTIAKGGMLGLVGRFLMLLFGLILQIVLARTLGPSKVGIINLGLAFTFIVGIVASFGLDKAVVRYIPGYRTANDYAHLTGTIITSLLMTLVISLVVTVIFFFSAGFWANNFFSKPTLEPILRIFAISLPFNTLMLLSVAIAQAYKRVGYRVAIEQTAVPALRIIGVLVVVFAFGAQMIGVAYALLVAEIAGCVIGLLSIWKLYPPKSSADTKKPVNLTRPLLAFAWPLAMTALFISTNNQLETFLLGRWSTADQVGIYSISIRPSAFIAISVAALNFIYAPFVSELFAKRDRIQLTRLYKTVTRWAIIISLPIFGVVFIFSPEIMRIFGQGFEAGVPVVRLLALSQIVFVATGPSAITLQMAGYPRLNLFNVLLSLALTFILDLFLIPRYGAIGAAIGGFVTITLKGVLNLGEVYFILHIHPYQKNTIKPLIASAFAMIIVTFLNSQLKFVLLGQLLLLGSLLIIIYLIVLLMLGLDKNDKQLMETIRRKFYDPNSPN